LSTGDAHRLASNPPVITHLLDVSEIVFEADIHYCIQIFADYIGILFVYHQQSELVVLNWKAGRMELVSDSSEPLATSFTFAWL
jgi:hypothetical protein